MNTKLLFHDMTLDYLRPAEPDKNRTTDIRFRCAAGDAEEITLVLRKERYKMKLSETADDFD